VSPVSRETPAGRAYLDLKAMARTQSRLTDELIQLYVLEGLLARLSVSEYADKLVLKGGILLAAFGTRRPTKDIDFAALDLDNDAAHILTVIRAVAASDPPTADGLIFDAEGATADVIRDEDEYAGVRVSMGARLASAQMRFHVDINVGDPVWPAPQPVEVPRLLGGNDLALVGYPLHMVHAEKIVTAIQRGTVNTRWRDFGDVWTLSGQHAVDGSSLETAIAEVAKHRNIELTPARDVLDGYAELAQTKWVAWRRRQRLDQLPDDFADLLEDFYNFADPAMAATVSGDTWDPFTRSWR
jgi:hypothetical protein